MENICLIIYMRLVAMLLFFFISSIDSFSAVVNILQNGSFEYGASDGLPVIISRNPPPFWPYLNLGNIGGSVSEANNTIQEKNIDPTLYGNRFISLGNGSSNAGNGLYQSFSVESGVTDVASLSVKKFSKGWSEPVEVTFDIRGGGGSVVNPDWTLSSSTLSSVYGEWRDISFSFTPLVAETLQLRIFDSTAPGTSLNSDLMLDNAWVYSIPEPSSLSLLALGGLVVALGRRKK